METPETPRLLKPAEAAGLLGVHPRTVGNWARAGKIACQRTLGGHRRYPEPDIRALALRAAA